MQKIKLYRITTVYVDPYFRDYWSVTKASNETHPDTGYEFERFADGGAVEFWLPDYLEMAYWEDGSPMGIIDVDGNRILEIDDSRNGEPLILCDEGFIVLKRAN